MWIEPGFSATAWADTTASLLDSPTTKDSKVNFGFRFVTHSSLKSSVTSLLGLFSFVSCNSSSVKYSILNVFPVILINALSIYYL